jgi:uncharacterized membrane protein
MANEQELEQRLADYEARLAALTRRVYELEQGGAAIAPQTPPLLNQQPLEVTPQPVEPTPVDPPPRADSWESSLGTNWLTRSGVVLIVIGIVLFLGYAMTDMGPASRVAVASTIAVTMLAAGYYFEQKGGWRPWSLGMLGGGFAVLYCTAYAAHAIPAAKIIDNHTLGAVLQAGIAVAAIFSALRYVSEAAVMLAYLAAFTGVLSSDTEALRFLGCIPLTVSGIWLAERLNWTSLRWSVFLYSWMAVAATADKLPESETWGQPGAWFLAILFASFEIYRRTKESAPWHALWLALNAAACYLIQINASHHKSDEYALHVLGLMAILGAVASLARIALDVRREALSEALTLGAAAIWISLSKVGPQDPLLAFVLILLLAMAALYWNSLHPTLALQSAGELTLGIASLLLLFVFPDSKKLASSPLTIRLALPQITLSMLCLFAAGRWFAATPWPSWLALITLAEITLWTAPKTIGTIILALEAIAAVAIGLYLNRRPIRIGGLALFAFSVLKVFLYDLSELDTLPRIFSFIVLGALLLSASWGYTRYRRELQKYL